jgi:queuine tRNA-ribosyltransferase
MLGPVVASLQNLRFYLWLMRNARKHILGGDFIDWKTTILPVITKKW